MAQPVTIRVSRTTVEPARWPYRQGLGALPVTRIRVSPSFVGLGQDLPDLFPDPTVPTAAEAVTLPAAVQQQLTTYQHALHDLAVAIQLAERTGQTAAATGLRQQFRNLLAVVDGTVTQIAQRETPGPALQQLARFSDAVIDTAQRVGEGVGDGVKRTASALKWLPWVAVGVGVLLLVVSLVGRGGGSAPVIVMGGRR